jgi:octopine/nopaline transport system ATP-binding protein
VTYETFQRAFIEAAKRSNAAISTYTLEGFVGPKNEELTTDVATLGLPEAENVVVVTSGVHGVELPLGSILQCRWFGAAQEVCSTDENVRFVFVHALNPFGAAHGLRNDQENIDVNRNFVDFDNKPKTSESYRILANAFSPKRLNPFALANAWRKLLTFGLLTHSISEFKQALAGGQYDFPDGLYYGGNHASWSRETWQSILKNHVIAPNLQNVWHVDLHTGDGPRGKMQILVSTDAGSPLHERAKLLGDTESVSLTQPAFAKLSGDVVDYWPRLNLPENCIVTPIAIEVGTSEFCIEGLDVLHVMITRNALKARYNDRHHASAKIIQRMREKFAPVDDVKWRERAAIQGQNFWNKLAAQVSPR